MNNREFIPEKLRDDYTYMLAAVTYNGTLFQFASKRLRNNHAIILAALKTSHDILEHAGDYLQNNRNFFMDMINLMTKFCGMEKNITAMIAKLF